MLQLKNIKKDYLAGENTVHALKGIDLNFRKSEFVSILGPSGCGKTTMLRIIGGFETADDGNVFFDGVNINDVPPNKRNLNTVFQKYALFPHMNVYENVAFAMYIVKATPKHIRRQVPMVLSLVGLSGKAKMYPNELSGGEQQRVALARALVNNPSMLIADEPTGNLDPDTAWDIMNLLNEINMRGTTVVVATHAKEIVDQMKKRVIHINKGVIVKDDKKGGYDCEI